MGIVEDFNWKREWAIANLEEELWQRVASYDLESRKKGLKAERLPPQIKTMHDHLQMDIKRVLYQMHGKPFLEYRFYAIAKAFDYAITGVDAQVGSKLEAPEADAASIHQNRSRIRLVKPKYKV